MERGQKVLNPETGRKIFVNGTTYKKLTKKYIVDPTTHGFLDLPNYSEPEIPKRKKKVLVPEKLQKSYGKYVSPGTKRFNFLFERYHYDSHNHVFTDKRATKFDTSKLAKKKLTKKQQHFNKQVLRGNIQEFIDGDRMGVNITYYHISETRTTEGRLNNKRTGVHSDEGHIAVTPLSALDDYQCECLKNILIEKLQNYVESNCLISIVLIEQEEDVITKEKHAFYTQDSRLPIDRVCTGPNNVRDFVEKFITWYIKKLGEILDQTNKKSGMLFIGTIGAKINFTPIRNKVGAFIPTPDFLTKNSIQNIKPTNLTDNKCFQYCLLYSCFQKEVEKTKRQYCSTGYNRFWKKPDLYKINEHSILDIEEHFDIKDNKLFQLTIENCKEVEEYLEVHLNVYKIELNENYFNFVTPFYKSQKNDLYKSTVNLLAMSHEKKEDLHFVVIRDISEFEKHILRNPNAHFNKEKVYKCSFCDYISTKKDQTIKHELIYHPELIPDEKKFTLSPESTYLEFTKMSYAMVQPVVCYCDYECSINENREHNPIMCSVTTISRIPSIKSEYKIFYGPNESPSDFLPMIEYFHEVKSKVAEYFKENTPMNYSKENEEDYQQTSHCPFCKNVVTDDPDLIYYHTCKNYEEKFNETFENYSRLSREVSKVNEELQELGVENVTEEIINKYRRQLSNVVKDYDFDKLYRYCKTWPCGTGDYQPVCNCFDSTQSYYNFLLCTRYKEKRYLGEVCVHESTNLPSRKVRHHAHAEGSYSNGKEYKYYKAGEYICTCCHECNINLKYNKKELLPVYFHNGHKYDNTFILQTISEYLSQRNQKMKVIATSMDKFMNISFNGISIKDSFKMITAPLKNMVNEMLGSNVSNYVYTSQIMEQYFRENNKEWKPEYIELLTRKEPMFYNLIKSYNSLSTKGIPKQEDIFDDLSLLPMNDEDYQCMSKIFETFSIQTWGEYYTLYNLLDTTLLADVFEQFRDSCLQSFTLDPAHFLTTPQMSFTIFTKFISCIDHERIEKASKDWAVYITKINKHEGKPLDLLERIYQESYYDFIEGDGIKLLTNGQQNEQFVKLLNNLRGGLTQISTRYCKVPEITPEEENVDGIYYFDANNLYGSCMMKFLPFQLYRENDYINYYKGPIRSQKEFIERINEDPEEFVNSIESYGPTGYFIECDITLPEELHDKFNDLPLFPTKDIGVLSEPMKDYARQNNLVKTLETTEEKLFESDKTKKLICNLCDKKNYLVHYEMLKLGLSLGYKITKIHSVICFRQAPFIFDYINYLSTERAKTKSAVLKNLFKLLANSLYGKFVETELKRIKVKPVTTYDEQQKLISKCGYQMIERAELYSKNLWVSKMYNPKKNISKPFFIGFAILDLSKYIMYDVYYNVLKKNFDTTLLAQDTDSLMVNLRSEQDIETKLCKLYNYFDFSELKEGTRMHNALKKYYDNNEDKVQSKFTSFEQFINNNKKVPLPLKDENCGLRALEFIGLRPKMYCMINEEQKIKKAAKGVSRAVKIDSEILRINELQSVDIYKQVLFPETSENTVIQGEITRINNQKLKVSTVSQQKVCFTCMDNKRYICKGNVKTYAWGHKDIPEEENKKFYELNSKVN